MPGRLWSKAIFAGYKQPLIAVSVRQMLLKKVFLVLVAVILVSNLTILYYGGQLRWSIEAFYLGISAPCSHLSPGLKPKQTNVVFLKTHKTGSSTMQNLLFRFAERHNLKVAFPINNCGYRFCYPNSFNTRFVHPDTLPANIITSHMRFNHTEVQKFMPNDTAYITILREPGSMFESSFTYSKVYCQSFKNVPDGSLETFMEDPQRYYHPGDLNVPARNGMTFDLGGDKDRPVTDAAYGRDFVAEVDRSFSLVMIMEYFDESLVLLRHLLSWDLDDILYVKLNMRAAGSKQSLAPGLSAKIRAWNSLDSQLYDHFNASLWRKLEALGPACVAREVRLLQQAQERLMQSCFGGQMPLLRSAKQIKNKKLRPWQPGGKVDIMGYDLPANVSQVKELCLKLIMPELQYSNILLRSQTLPQKSLPQGPSIRRSRQLPKAAFPNRRSAAP